MLLPTIFMGATFGITAVLVTKLYRGVGDAVGVSYFCNTLGCIVGSFMTGFVLIPFFGIQKTIIIAVFINLSVALLVLISLYRPLFNRMTRPSIVSLVLTLFLFPTVRPWSKSLLTSDISIHPHRYLSNSIYEIKTGLAEREVLFYQEGLQAIVSVMKSRGDNLYLLINGKTDAATGDMYTQLLLGHLPMLLQAQAKTVLVIGMGSGCTLGAVASYPSCRQIDCVELEEAVVKGAAFFASENRNVLRDHRLRVFTNDARNHLLVSPDTYDVVISEPSNPWIAGEASLFTVDQFRLMSSRLNPGGIACQWLHVYSMSPRDVRMIMRSFSSVFKHVSLWYSTPIDLMLIGSDAEIPFDYDRIENSFAENALVREDFRRFDIEGAAGLLSCFMLSENEVKEFCRFAELNTDVFPRLEFSAPLSLYKETAADNLSLLLTYRKERYPRIINKRVSLIDDEMMHNELARAYLFKDFFSEAIKELEWIRRINREMSPDTLFTLGLLYLKGGKYEDASIAFQRYIVANPMEKRGYFYLGSAYEKKGLLKEACLAYQKAVMLAPENSEYRLALGRCSLSSGDYLGAQKQLEIVVRLEGLHTPVGILLARAYFLTGEGQKGTAILKNLIHAYPSMYSLYEVLATYYLGEDLNEEALGWCKQAARLFPYHARNYQLMSTIYEKLGKKDSAMWALRLAQRYGRK
jgi:spermidine synthase